MAALLGNGGDSELVLQGSNFTYIFPWHLEICDYFMAAPCSGAFHSFQEWYFHSVPTSQVSIDDSGAVVFAIQ